MPSYVGSIALIPEETGHQTRWLTHCDRTQGMYRLVMAERLEDDTYRECLDRELAWTFGLDRGKDYLISSAPRLHLNFPTQLPDTDEPTFYVVEFYLVTPYGQAGRTKIAEHPDAIWMSGEEIASGSGPDGLPFHEGQRRLLCHGEVFSPH